MEGKCIVRGCGKAASKCCGSCGFARYCSIECQKDDWKKVHKKFECVNMKKLASVILTEEEISDVGDRISWICGRHLAIGEARRSADIYMMCIDFVRRNLGPSDRDDSHRLTGDHVRPNHITLCRLLASLGQIYFHMARSPEIDSYCISITSEARELLVQMNDTVMNQQNLWPVLMHCETILIHLYSERGQSEKAKYHAVECVATARHYEGPEQASYLIEALGTLSSFLRVECNFPESLALAEESYIIASKLYSPAHRIVLEAGGKMIDCLTDMKDFSTADTYCRMNYANVIDPVNAGEYSVDDGINVMNQLVSIWLEKEPDEDEIVEKALADEAIDLSRKVLADAMKSGLMPHRINCLCTLCRVLLKGNELTEETEGLLHQLVTMCITKQNLAENGFYYGDELYDSFEHLYTFYTKLYNSFQMGKKTTLVQKNIELCDKKLLKLQSCNESSVGYVKMSQKIKPYFKGNVALHI